nr:hypothetical protein [Haliscomenobacter sp.]
METSQGVLTLSAQFVYKELAEFSIEGLVNGRMLRQGTNPPIYGAKYYGVLTALAATQPEGTGLVAFGFQNGQIVLGRMDVVTLEINNLRHCSNKINRPSSIWPLAPVGATWLRRVWMAG